MTDAKPPVPPDADIIRKLEAVRAILLRRPHSRYARRAWIECHLARGQAERDGGKEEGR